MHLVCTWFVVELEFGNVVFEERGKQEYAEKNPSEQREEPTTNSTHINYDVDAEIWTQTILVGGECSRHP